MRKEIIVLANSWRTKNRCIAGICRETGEWIRPISAETDDEAILTKQVKHIKLLDIVEIYLTGERPNPPDPYQCENWFIDESKINWSKTGQVKPEDIKKWCENGGKILHSKKNAVHETQLQKRAPNARQSLVLIEANVRFKKWKNKQDHEKWHGLFEDGEGNQLSPTVTDPDASEHLNNDTKAKNAHCMLCISLAKPIINDDGKFDVFCHKLIAGVIWL